MKYKVGDIVYSSTNKQTFRISKVNKHCAHQFYYKDGCYESEECPNKHFEDSSLTIVSNAVSEDVVSAESTSKIVPEKEPEFVPSGFRSREDWKRYIGLDS